MKAFLNHGRSAYLGWALMAMLALVIGCGGSSDVATVSGMVTLDGVPAMEGSINFAPADGQGPTVGTSIRDGKYEITTKDKMPPGKKVVTIIVTTKTGRQVEAGPPAPKGTMVNEIKVYPQPGGPADLQSTTLVVGENTSDFKLVSGAR